MVTEEFLQRPLPYSYQPPFQPFGADSRWTGTATIYREDFFPDPSHAMDEQERQIEGELDLEEPEGEK